jgi:hypothetical protein
MEQQVRVCDDVSMCCRAATCHAQVIAAKLERAQAMAECTELKNDVVAARRQVLRLVHVVHCACVLILRTL